MESRLMIPRLLSVILIIALCSAGPIPKSQDKCSDKCDESRNLLNYKKGSIYIYKFNNLITTHIPKGTRQSVQVAISATARFRIVDSCEISLEVKNAKMKEVILTNGNPSTTKTLTMLPQLLEKYHLPFGFNDGRVTGICDNSDENRLALNVKKAMISQFQISMEQIVTPTSLTERDVSGDCLTEYRYDRELGAIVHINKTKAILGCANRKASYSDLQGQNFDKATENSQMPLLDGHQKCALRVSRKGHLVSSHCKEKQVFKPFSGPNSQSGVTFDVEQTLKLEDVIEGDKGFKHTVFPNRNSLLLEHNPTGYRNFGNPEEDIPEDILNYMCNIVKNKQLVASKSIVGEFPRLVRSLRFGSEKEFNKIISTIGKSTCGGIMRETGMRLFLDALPMVRTTESAIFMLDGLASGRFAPLRRSWLFSLATMREPTSEIIQKLAKVTSALDSPLTVSAIVNTYCKSNEFCTEEKAVVSIVKQITDRLQGDCSARSEKILVALRAIGNLGAASDWKIINACLKNKKIPMGHRVSAAQAIRHLRCDHSGWEHVELMNHFLDEIEDPELRITTYLSLMSCPQKEKVLKSIIDQLDRERSQQVGSFVFSHLSNLLETSQVFRKNLKEQLRRIRFDPRRYAKRFNLDPRRYSRNFEKSLYNERLNSGVSFEGNVIYSHDSFVPRSSTFNITGGLFGKSISLFELGLRTTNMDGLVRKTFGKDFPPQRNNGQTMVHFDISKMQNPQRSREDPSMDLHLRLFGNELIYQPNIRPAEYLKKASQMNLGLLVQYINNNPVSLSHTRMLMEAVISVPTLSGFPLELSLDVASRLDLAADMQIVSDMKGGGSVKTNLKPNGGIGVNGRMRLDAHCTEIGIEFIGNAITETKMGLEIKKTGSEMTLLLNAPQEKQTVIDMKGRIVMVSQRKILDDQMLTDKKVSTKLCTGKRMEAALGMKICATGNYAEFSRGKRAGPSFPFNGENAMTVQVTPTSDVQKYKVRGKYVPSDTAVLKVENFEIELNAEGDSKDRQILLAYNDRTKAANLDMSLKLRSPQKTIDVSAKGDLSKYQLDAKVAVNTKDVVKLTSRTTVQNDNRVTTVKVNAMGVADYILLTHSADTTLGYGEFDRSLKLTTKASLKSFRVMALKKMKTDGSTDYKFAIGSQVGERSAELYIQGNVKFNEKSQLMISNSKGNIGINIKKKEAVSFKYDNNWNMRTTFDKELKDSVVTEHAISFDQTIQPEKFSKLNVKDGRLVIQHDLQSSDDEMPSQRTLNVLLKANKIEVTSENKFIPKLNPFELDSRNSLKTKTLNLKNRLTARYRGWKDMKFENIFENGGRKYMGLIENVISLERTIQTIKVSGPGVLYHVNSKLTKTDKSFFDHVGLVAWSPEKSLSLKSTISWGFKDPDNFACETVYEVSSKAYKGKQLIGDSFISTCPDIANRKISLELRVTRGKGDKSLIIYFIQDGTFKLDRKDFHIGGSTTLTIPGKVDFDFSMNQIYYAKEDMELVSNVNFNKRSKKGEEKQYGYKLRLVSKDVKEKRTITGKLKVLYPMTINMLGDIQMDSTYRTKIEYEKKGGKYQLKQMHSAKSMLWGNAALEMDTEWEMKDKFEFKSKHNLEGKLEFVNIYEIKGEQKIKGELSYFESLKLEEESKFKLKNKTDDTKKTYKHNTEFEGSIGLDDSFNINAADCKIDFESNYPLSSLSYKSSYKTEGNYLRSKDELKWTFMGSKKNVAFEAKSNSKENILKMEVELTSSFDVLKKAKLGGEVNFNKFSAAIKGEYNDKSVEADGDLDLGRRTARSIYGKPDAKLVINVKPSDNIESFKGASVTFATFYRHRLIKYFDLQGTVSSSIPGSLQLAAGFANLNTGGFIMKYALPIPKSLGKMPRKFDAVVMLEGEKPNTPAPVLEIKLEAPKMINALLKSTAKSKGKGINYRIAMHLIRKRVIVAKNTALIIDTEQSTLMENKGTITMLKGENADFDISATFDYRISFENFKLKTNTDYTFFEKDRRITTDIRSIFEVRKNKKFEVLLIPSRKSPKEKLYILVEHDGEPLWNFNSKVVASVPLLKSSNEASMRFFMSTDGSKTTTSELRNNAVFAFDFKVKSSVEAIKELKAQVAFSKNKKGKVVLLADTKLLQKSLEATIDASAFPNFDVTVKSEGKQVGVTFTKSGKTGRFIAKVGGKSIGSADLKYDSGRLLKIDVTIQPPKSKAMEFRFKQKHAGDNWLWSDWSHKSGFSVWTKDNKNIKFDQGIIFKFEEGKLGIDANVKSTIKAIEKMYGKLRISTGTAPSSYLSFTLDSNDLKTKVNHKMEDWMNPLQGFNNKISVSKSRKSVLQVLLSRSKTLKMHLKFENALVDQLKLLEYRRTERGESIELNGSFGQVNLKTNIVTLLYRSIKSVSGAAGGIPKSVYLSGDLPKYGKIELRVSQLSPLNYQIKMKLGEKFLNINPKLTMNSLRPFDVALKVKISSHMERLRSCNIRISQKISRDLKSAEHSSSLRLNSKTPYQQYLKYDISDDNAAAKYDLKLWKYRIYVKANYNKVSSKYSHKIDVGIRGRRKPIFLSTADCEPYSFSKDNAKCVFTSIVGGKKQALELINTAKGSKSTKSIKLAWNDLKNGFLKVRLHTSERKESTLTKLNLYTPLRNFQIYEEFDDSTGFYPVISFRTIKRRGESILGHITIRTIPPTTYPEEKTIIKITSNLLKKEIRFVTTVKKLPMGDAEEIEVKSDMYIGSGSSSKLSLIFQMKKESALKNDLKLELKGQKRYLNLFARYDLTKPEQTISIGADAKDWKRRLDIVYENGKRLETSVTTDKSVQKIKMTSERMARNGYRNILELDYPEVSGYFKVITQFSRYPLSLLVIVHSDKKDPENKLVINGRFMNSKNILFEIKRFQKSSIIMDTYTQVTLDSQNVITQLKWRPGLLNDIKGYILRELRPTKLTQYLKNRGVGLKEVVQRVVSEIKMQLLQNLDAMEAEAMAQAVTNDFLAVNATIMNFGNFVLKEVEKREKLMQALTSVVGALTSTLAPLYNYTAAAGSQFTSMFNQKDINEMISKQYKLLYGMLGDYLKDFNEQWLVKVLNKAKKEITQAREKFSAFLQKLTIRTKAWIAKRNAFFNRINAAIMGGIQSVSGSMKGNQRAKTFMASMAAFSQSMKKFVSEMIPEELINKVWSKEDTAYWRNTIRKLQQLLSWTTSRYYSGRKQSDWRKSMQLLGEGDIKQAFDVYFKPELTGIKRWDPKRGSINWQVHLPYNIKNLQSIPLAIYAYTQSRAKVIAGQLRQGTFQLGKFYVRLNEEVLRYSPKKVITRQLPPYASFAFVLGSQHFVTFDGVNIEHARECPYLLVHDYINHSFSVLAKYERRGRMMSIIVQTPSVALYMDISRGIFTMKKGRNGRAQRVTLPTSMADLSVWRLRDMIRLTGPQGLSLHCNVRQDTCRIHLSEWSHAKVNGLLGTNDYDKGNDLVMPKNGKNLSKEDILRAHTNHWRAGSCSAHSYTVKESKGSKAPGYRFCRYAFMSSRSSLARCYSKVPPKEYMQTCLNMYKMKQRTGACKVLYMYANKCVAYGINVRIPISCVTCGKSRRSIWRLLGRRKVPDKKSRNFVFLVEDKACIKGMMRKLTTLLNIMSRRNTGDMYTMLTYGGNGVYKKLSNQMMGGSITGKLSHMLSALRRLKYNGKDDESDAAFKALDSVLRMDDHLKKSTIIVMLSCTGCTKVSRARGYGLIAFNFRRRRIPFHYITQHSLGSHRNQEIIGFDNTNLFGKGGRKLFGVPSRALNYRRDVCEALSRSTGGSMWSINSLKSESSFGISKMKSIIRKIDTRRKRRCTCGRNNAIRCQ